MSSLPPSRPPTPNGKSGLFTPWTSPDDLEFSAGTPTSPSVSAASDLGGTLDPEEAVGAINASAALAGSVASLVRESTNVISNATWMSSGGDHALCSEEMRAMIQEVRTLMDLDMKILEALDKLSRVQVDISERSYQIEGQVDNLRSDVRQSKSSASRLLNRAKEHIRGEHENIQQERRATYKAHDKMAEDLRREVTHTMALLNRQDRIALCQIHQLEAELAALRASFWSARIYVFIVSVVTACNNVVCAGTFFMIGFYALLVTACSAGFRSLVAWLRRHSDTIRIVFFSLVLTWLAFLSVMFIQQTRGALVEGNGPVLPARSRGRPLWESARG